jgi:choline kinase
MRVSVAVVLAAGLGTRLRDVHTDAPKAFVEVNGETLIARSLRLLRSVGIERVVIVTGHGADVFAAFAAGQSDVELVHNADYASTGSMASLACALDGVDEDFLLLEADLFYEVRALCSLFESDAPDALLTSGPTYAGDEVYVEAPAGRLVGMSKDRGSLASVDGELVGITRVSAPLSRAMHASFDAFVAREGHGRMAYETDALVRASRTYDVRTVLVSDLLWGEIDDASHLARIRDRVAPAVAAIEGVGRPTK